MFHQNLLEPSHQFSFFTHLRKYLGAKAAQFLAEHASVNIFRFRGRNCQSDGVFCHRKSNQPEMEKFAQKSLKKASFYSPS